MQIIHATITFVLIFTTLYSYGFFILNKIYKKNNVDIFFKILAGYTFVGVITVILHFFFKIDNSISILIITFALIIFFVNFSKFDKKEFGFLTIILPVFSFILFSYSEHPIDTNMYHHPYVSYLKSEKIIFAVANIQFRFGHTSFLQYVQATMTNDLLHLISLSSNIMLSKSFGVSFVSNTSSISDFSF